MKTYCRLSLEKIDMKVCNVTFNKEKLILDIVYTFPTPMDITFVITDLAMDCPYYTWDVSLSQGDSWWISPLPENLKLAALNSPTFSGFRCKIYHNRQLIQFEDFVYNSRESSNNIFLTNEFDVTGHSYLDFFHSDLCKGMDFRGTVIDAGANVGFFTLLALQNGADRVYSIEPDRGVFFYLQRNFISNPRVHLVDKAMSAVNGQTDFFYIGSSVANTAVRPNQPCAMDVVPTINLETFLQIESRINLVKLDIEGSEFEVIDALSNDMYSKINQFFIEFHKVPHSIEQKLRETGFSVEYRHSSPVDSTGFIYAKNKNFI